MDVTELPSTHPRVWALRSVRNNLKPEVFNFRIPSGVVSVAVRLSGTSLLTSHSSQATILVQPGSSYLLSEGAYAVIFGKRSSETIFLLADRTAIPEIEPFLATRNGQLPHTSIELTTDPIFKKIEAIQDTAEANHFFMLSSLLLDLLERLDAVSSDLRTLYRLPQLDPVFEKVCLEVIAMPQEPWNVPDAAAKCGYSVYHFSRTFKAKTGQGFPEFVNRVRSIQSVLLMCEQRKLPDEALESVGIGAGSSANKVLLKELGLTVTDIRKMLTLTDSGRRSA